MAKISQVLRDEKRNKLIDKYAARRSELRAKIKVEEDPDAQAELIYALSKLPRNSCPARKTRRCLLTGRSRAVYRKFGLCRVVMRDLALRGDLPGVTKSSW